MLRPVPRLLPRIPTLPCLVNLLYVSATNAGHEENARCLPKEANAFHHICCRVPNLEQVSAMEPSKIQGYLT